MRKLIENTPHATARTEPEPRIVYGRRMPPLKPALGRVTAKQIRSSSREKADLADLVDKLVAKRIRARRIELGMTQQSLADQIGVASQQIHKYERGISRITAGRLAQLAGALDLSVDDFFAYHGSAKIGSGG